MAAKWIWLGVVLGSAYAIAADSSREAATVPREVKEWIRDNAFPLSSVRAGTGFADLQPLGAIIGSAPIVALGEATHGSREMAQLNHRLFEYLVRELGFSIFALEANLPEVQRLNEYVGGGDGDPVKLLRGLYFQNWRTQEVLDLVGWMRAFNAGHAARRRRVEFAGLDMQSADQAAEIATRFLAQTTPAWKARATDATRLLDGVRPRDPVGFVTGNLPLERLRGRTVSLGGWIQTRAVQRGYAGFLLRADTRSRPSAALENMYRTGPRGDTDWTHYEITVAVPADAIAVAFGFLLDGTGIARFDEVEIKIDGERWEPGASLDLSFEAPALRGLNATRSSYRAELTRQAHGGAQALELRSLDLGEDTTVSATAVWREIEAALNETSHRAAGTPQSWAARCARLVNQYLALNAPHASENGSVMRDRFMAENLAWWRTQRPGAKIAVWAHNGHVRRAPGSMGNFLSAHLRREEMIVVGFATGNGTYRAWGTNGPEHFPLAPPMPGSVEAALVGSAPELCVLDLRTARDDGPGQWFDAPRSHRLIGGGEATNQFVNERRVASDYDVLVWLANTSATSSYDAR